MDEVRKGEIALIFLKMVLSSKKEAEWIFADNGKWLSSDSGHDVMRYTIKKLAEVAGISGKEADEFSKTIVQEMIYDSWGPAAPFC